MRNGIEFTKIWTILSETALNEKNEPVETPKCRVPDIRLEEKKAWWALTAKNGNVIYVAKQKLVRQVDLSGFGKGFVGTEKLRAPNGRVQAHLDLGDDNALFHLEQLLLVMASLASAEKKRVAPMGASSKPKVVKEIEAASSPISTMSTGDKAAVQERLDRLFGIAKMRGVEVSDATVAKLIALGAVPPEGYASSPVEASVQADESDETNEIAE